jgi:hypothetical protein
VVHGRYLGIPGAGSRCPATRQTTELVTDSPAGRVRPISCRVGQGRGDSSNLPQKLGQA